MCIVIICLRGNYLGGLDNVLVYSYIIICVWDETRDLQCRSRRCWTSRLASRLTGRSSIRFSGPSRPAHCKAATSCPPFVQLAVDLSINPNTVVRAYRELEIRGILTTQQGIGTFVTTQPVPVGRGRAPAAARPSHRRPARPGRRGRPHGRRGRRSPAGVHQRTEGALMMPSLSVFRQERASRRPVRDEQRRDCPLRARADRRRGTVAAVTGRDGSRHCRSSPASTARTR